jgi:dTDP-4-amino-4,6-dideoxygalactose transaminase
LHAALGRAQLKKLEPNNQRRRDLLLSYREAMRSLSGWIMPFAEKINYSSGHLMVAVAPEPEIKQRAVQALHRSGIQSSLHYPCVANFTAFECGSDDDLAVTPGFYLSGYYAAALPNLGSGSDQ